MIPCGRQEITEDDIAEVEKILRSDFLTQGPLISKFEQSVADYCGASFGVAANVHYIPVHRQPYYENMGFKKGDFPEAEKFYQEVISIPMYPDLKEEKQQHVIDTLKKAFEVYRIIS